MITKNSPADPAQINMIAEGTEVEGTLRAKDDIRVSGRVKGALHVDGKAIIAQDGVVEGDIHANDADISGKVSGEIVVKGRLVLKATARVEGSISTSRLIMEEGAVFEGKCEMGKLDKSRAQALDEGSASKLPASNRPPSIAN